MRKTQLGVSLGGLLMGLALLVIVGIFGMKLIPVYIEFYKAKAAIVAIGQEKQSGATPAEIRKSFDARASIDDIESIKSADLEITREGNQPVIGFAYRKEVPMGANIGVYIDFSARSRPD
jgi:hypothetical protein